MRSGLSIHVLSNCDTNTCSALVPQTNNTNTATHTEKWLWGFYQVPHTPNPVGTFNCLPTGPGLRSFAALFASPSRDWSLLKALMLGTHRAPTSTVTSVTVYPDSCTLAARSWYFACFLLAASSSRVSNGMVSSSNVTCLVLSFHQTISGRRGACEGKWRRQGEGLVKGEMEAG